MHTCRSMDAEDNPWGCRMYAVNLIAAHRLVLGLPEERAEPPPRRPVLSEITSGREKHSHNCSQRRCAVMSLHQSVLWSSDEHAAWSRTLQQYPESVHHHKAGLAELDQYVLCLLGFGLHTCNGRHLRLLLLAVQMVSQLAHGCWSKTASTPDLGRAFKAGKFLLYSCCLL